MSDLIELYAPPTESYTDHPLDSIPALRSHLHSLHLTRHTHSYPYRLHHLKQVGYMLQDNVGRICESMKRDMGRRGEEVMMQEIWPNLRESDLAVKRLSSWMAEESGWGDTIWAFRANNPRIRKDPKGVALIIGPWNFPWFLNVGPLIGAIAAGCPVVIKPSEHSPHSSLLLAQLVREYLDPKAHFVVLGAVECSGRLLEEVWGHVFFTGSTAVGKIIATATAKNLVSCTLELGGKSPVIVTEDANLIVAARRILSVKAYGAGQICTNADYVLCPKGKVGEFMKAMEQVIKEFYPSGPLSSTSTSQLIHPPAFQRISNFISQARSAGYKMIGGEVDEAGRRVGVTVVDMGEVGDLVESGKGEKEGLLREEIFGPILPVVGVDSIDEAIAYVNARPNPLALYVFSAKRKDFEYVLDRTLSGGACWNDISMQTLQRGIPFGGVGQSGWGSGHGKAGFEEFTHRRSTLDVPMHTEAFMRLRYPNAPAWGHKAYALLMGHKLAFSRSKSVADEEKKLWLGKRWSKVYRLMLFVVALMIWRRYR